jgi:hypothetical protein
MKITNKDIELILQKIEKIPSFFWLPKEPTEDQYLHWWQINKLYGAIHEELKSYFAGEESPLPTKAPKDDFTTFVILQANNYITLYSLYRYAWQTIKTTVENTDTSNYDKYYLQAIKTITTSETPGALLATILELNSKSYFEDCLFYRKFSPRNIYKLIQESERYQRSRGDSSKSTEMKNLKFEKDLQQRVGKYPGFFIQVICTHICTIYLDKHKDEILKDYFLAHEKSKLQLIAHQKSFYHPNQKRRPNEWNKGNIKFS